MAVKFDDEKFVTTKTEGIANISYDDKDIFNQGTDIDKDVMVAVFKHSGEFIAETTTALADKSAAMFNEDKDLNKIIVDVPYGPTGSGSVTTVIHREKTFRVPGTDKSISRPDIGVAVKHPMLKAGKTHVKSLQKELMEKLK